MKDGHATTLRELYEMIRADGEEFLDAPLLINVRSANSVTSEAIPLRVDLWACPRSASVPQTKEAASLRIDLHLQKHSLTKLRTK